jgi:hypothetical protein
MAFGKGQASRLCRPVTDSSVAGPHDEHGVVGVAKDRQAADNDQLNRPATFLEISRHTPRRVVATSISTSRLLWKV